MADTFSRTYIITKEQKHKKDLVILDGDVPVYGILRENKSKIAEVIKFDENGGKQVLAEVEWLGDRKDKIRISGGEWQRLNKAWQHYNTTVDAEKYVSAFTGADDQRYIWHLRGSMKVLTRGDKSGPVVAKHVDHHHGGTLDIKDDATAAQIGDMLWITFLSSEGFRGRTRFSWFGAL
ncbi:hypothetical protein FRC19_010439 [Serendipita sp. 401]|nr:hypothetical protein FRC19_010439 [Serendipita sp. 401]